MKTHVSAQHVPGESPHSVVPSAHSACLLNALDIAPKPSSLLFKSPKMLLRGMIGGRGISAVGLLKKPGQFGMTATGLLMYGSGERLSSVWR